MTRGRRLLLLCGALIVVGGGAFAAVQLAPDETESTEEAETVTVFSAESDSITALSWTRNGETVSLTKTDDTWSDPEDSALPVQQSYLESMVSALEEVSSAKTIEAPEDTDQYGMDDPQCTVTVTDSDGNETTLTFGDETSLGGELYLTNGDGNVYLVDTSLLDYFAYGRYDLIEMESIPSMSDLSSVTVVSGTGTLELEQIEDSGLTYSDSITWFTPSGDSYQALGSSEVSTFTSQITGLSWNSCVSYNATEDELADYGLDSPTVTVTVNYVETTTVDTNETDEDGNTITEERQEDKSFVLEVGDYAEDGCYARIADSNMVYLIDSSIADSLLYTSASDLLTTSILEMDWDYLTGFDVTAGDESWSFTVEREVVTDEDTDTSTTEITYLLDGEEMDADSVASFLTTLNSTASTGTASVSESQRSAELSITFYQDDSDWPEVELSFYPYDSSSDLVSLNGEARLLVDSSTVDSLIETLTALPTAEEAAAEEEAAEETEAAE